MTNEPSTTLADTTVAARHHDWTGDYSIAVTIVEALEEAGVDPREENSCLCDVVDPDALDDLFRPTTSRRARGYATFRFAGHDVAVHADGRVALTPRAGGADAGDTPGTGGNDVVE